MALWLKGGATPQRPGGFRCFQPHLTQLPVFSGEARAAALVTCSGWSARRLSAPAWAVGVCSYKDCSADRSDPSTLTSKDDNATNKETCKFTPYHIIIVYKLTHCNASVPGTAAATCSYPRHLSDSVTFRSHPEPSRFKGPLPCHVWSPQVLCCSITPAVQQRRLHHPPRYKMPGLLSCGGTSTGTTLMLDDYAKPQCIILPILCVSCMLLKSLYCTNQIMQGTLCPYSQSFRHKTRLIIFETWLTCLLIERHL